MGAFTDTIPDKLIKWIQKQEMFFVATAPLSGNGHVNISPKGLRGTFHVVSNTRVWYQDLSGSGVETISHLRENGRITVMFCAFEGAANIVRLFGTGTVHEFGTPEYFALIPPEQRLTGSRAAIVIDVHKVGSSCGFAVPLYTFKSHRTALTNYSLKLEKRDEEYAADETSVPSEDVPLEDQSVRQYAKNGLKIWWAQHNVRSLDGLPALSHAHVADMVPKHGSLAELPGKEKAAAAHMGGASGFVQLARLSLEPASKEEVVRLAVVFALGITAAAFYVRVIGQL